MIQPVLRFSVPFVLASRSPRRKQLLAQLGLKPEILPSDAEELMPRGSDPATLVQKLALDKAEDVATRRPKALVLGADTVVVRDGEILGKPGDAAEARAVLGSLSGRSHHVFTGIALVGAGRSKSGVACTEVTFGTMSDTEIATYVAGGSPMDKAGAYGIQDDAGALFVERINGDYYNVVGLPLRTLYVLLVREFSDLLVP